MVQGGIVFSGGEKMVASQVNKYYCVIFFTAFI